MPVAFEPVPAFPADQLKRNEDYSGSLGLPSVDSLAATGPLAIVGGGPSILQYRYTLQSWAKNHPGCVWAVNRTWAWCRDNGIAATFFSFDPNPSVADMVDGAERAILGKKVDVSVFEKLAGREVYLGDGDTSGTTSAGEAIVRGFGCGHPTVTLFGCDACYQPGATHAYGHWQPADELVVWCNDMHFITNPQMLMAGVEISSFVRSAPEVLRERSGGLLRALVENKDYDIVGYTPGFEAKWVKQEDAA